MSGNVYEEKDVANISPIIYPVRPSGARLNRETRPFVPARIEEAGDVSRKASIEYSARRWMLVTQ